MWINKDIGFASDDNVEACFHLSNCYVWNGPSGGDNVSQKIDMTMGGYSIPEGMRDICIDELTYDANLWRQAKNHMNQISVGGGYLNRVGEYVERKENDIGITHAEKKDMSWLYVDEDYPIHPDAGSKCNSQYVIYRE